MIEASFDGEFVQTDLADHLKNPEFNTEFTWLISKKGLHLHRLQRSPVKVQCYVILESGQKDLLGYVIIDIRLARDDALSPIWYTLLNSKYQKQKPEILMGLSLEAQSSGNIPQEVEKVVQNSNQEISNKDYELQLNEIEGLYEIGIQDGASIYSLSVTIACVQNIDILFSNDKTWDSSSGLFFFYTLFGNDITTEPFRNDKSPEFPAERAAVKLRCHPGILLRFMKSLPNLQIYLCCGDLMFGKAEVPISTVAENSQLALKPQTYDGLYELKNLDNGSTKVDDVVKAYVGVSICLRKESIHQNLTSKTIPKTTIDEKTMKTPHKKLIENTEPRKDLKSRDVPCRDFDQNLIEANKIANPQTDLRKPENVEFNSNHYFCFTVDLRKLTLNLHQVSRCSVSYQYEFFGCKKPITSPVIDIKCDNAITIPQGYCMFNFTTSPLLLTQTFNQLPICVKVFNLSLSQPELIGTCKIFVNPVLNAVTKPIKNSQGMNGSRQLYTCSNPIISSTSQEIIGEIFSLMALDSFGKRHQDRLNLNEIPASDDHDSLFLNSNSNLPHFKKLKDLSDSPPTNSSSSDLPEIINRQAAMHLATELEAWKAQQQIIFQRQLKEKEEKHVAALNMEWIKRDKDREQILHKKLNEHKEMEKRLEAAMADIEKRKSKLITAEHQVSNLKMELKQQKEGVEKNFKERQEKLHEEFKRTNSLEKRKHEDLAKKFKNLKEERDELQNSLKSLERHFDSFKQELHMKPEVILKSQIDILNLEKTELERKLDSAVKSRIHYKQQWGRALRELTRIKQIQQDQARQKLQKQQQELDMLKLQHHSDTFSKRAEQQQSGTEERRVLKDIQAELIKLKDDILPPVPKSAPHIDGDEEEENYKDGDYNEKIRRSVVNERDTLLKTGVYTMEDDLILDFNKNIEQLMQAHS
ncbi:Centrosomal protein [Nymphon striatum]|nr:Centrosomal protein [Nymphon striatum]